MIMRMMMTLTGLILSMLGIIVAVHSDHQVLGVLLLFSGVVSMLEGLPKNEELLRLKQIDMAIIKLVFGIIFVITDV